MASVIDLASGVGSNPLNDNRTSAIVIPLDQQDNIRRGDARSFQYFPATVSDQKGINWQTKEIPGGSLPIYQWISSGARTISFTAVFTSDVDLNSQTALPQRLQAVGQSNRNVDVRAAAVWLRQFMFPGYGPQTQLGSPTTYAPCKLILFLPSSGVGMAGGASAFTHNDSICCVMTQCDFDFTAYFPSGLPRVMQAQLSFAQLAQQNGAISFPSLDSFDPTDPMWSYIYTNSPTAQTVPGGSAVDGPQPANPDSPSLGYNVGTKTLSQVLAASSFT